MKVFILPVQCLGVFLLHFVVPVKTFHLQQNLMSVATSFVYRYDEHTHERFAPGDPSKRAFTYFVLTGGRFIYASALRLAVLKFVLSMSVGLGLGCIVPQHHWKRGKSRLAHLEPDWV